MPPQPTRILSAEEVKASISRHRRVVTREERDFKKKQAEQEAYQDIRDDVASIIKNSGMSFEDIHARCGPHPKTLENWAEKKVSKPQMGKLRSVLRILGYDFAIVDGSGQRVLTKEPPTQ
jgi:hypothetical protein